MTLTPTSTVPTWIDHWAEQRPNDPAVIGRAILTWQRLAQDSSGLAAHLRRLGVQPGDTVTCLLPNDERYYVAFAAIARAGAVLVPVNTQLHTDEVAWLLSDSAARVVITDPELAGALPKTAELTVVAVDERTTARRDDSSANVTPDDPIAILYTSGTTGRPKGAVFTHAAFAATAHAMTEVLSLNPQDRHLVVSPLAFTGGILTSSQPALYSGGTILIQDGFEPAGLIARIVEARPTIFMAVPTMLALLREHPTYHARHLRSLRYVGSGSSPVPDSLLAALRADHVRIGHAYGLTEAGGMCTLQLPEEMLDHGASAGRPVAGVELRVVDDAGIVRGAEEVGELQVRGPALMREYHGNPDATVQAIDGSWLRTGDLASIDAEGYLQIKGRTKDVIITGGINVYPAEVESVLAGHPQVRDAAVVGIAHETFGETVAAFVVPGAERPSVEQIRDYCAERLAKFKVPRIIHLLDDLPRTTSGKVMKQALRDRAQADRQA